MISSMLDFNQRGEITNQRLIDNVGRVVMLSGPHNDTQENRDFPSEFIQGLMDENGVTTLTSLDTSLNINARWNMYLNQLVNVGGLRIVVGTKDHILCIDDSACDVSMHKATNRWIQEVTKDNFGLPLYDIYDLPEIVKVVEDANHSIPLESFKYFIMD